MSVAVETVAHTLGSFLGKRKSIYNYRCKNGGSPGIMTQSNRKFTAADLIPGRFYTVVKAFTDYDGLVHDVGETWKFARKNFLPYEDGLTLHIEKAGTPTMIRMQWTDEAQGPIIDDFSDYVNELLEG